MSTIRAARSYDVSAIAALCSELGYPATRPQIVARLAAIEAAGGHCVLVAEDGDGHVVGWLHAAQAVQLAADPDAEILGLVVAAKARGARIGADLLRAAEDWARRRGASLLRVRSRIERERAHNFYEREGYSQVKVQLVLEKRVG
jgi:GNAT superfamily N-acetyltransferase